MRLTGDMLIGGAAVQGSGAKMRAVDPSNGSDLDPSFSGGTTKDVERPADWPGQHSMSFAKPAWKCGRGCLRVSRSKSLHSGIL